MSLAILFIEFVKIGLFAVGGGLATIPFIYDLSSATNWFSNSELVNMIAVAQCVPGAFGVNLSIYVGYVCQGIKGGLISGIGLVIPSIVVIIIIAGFLKKFKDSKIVSDIFDGIRPASVALLVMAVAGILKTSILTQSGVDVRAILLGGVIYVLFVKFKAHPIVYMFFAGIIGVLLKM